MGKAKVAHKRASVTKDTRAPTHSRVGCFQTIKRATFAMVPVNPKNEGVLGLFSMTHIRRGKLRKISLKAEPKHMSVRYKGGGWGSMNPVNRRSKTTKNMVNIA